MPLRQGTYAFGVAFEAFVVNEIVKLQNYHRKDFKLSYLRTKDDAEIDLIIERSPNDRILVEIKSSSHIRESDARNLNAFASSMKHTKALLISNDSNPKQFGKVRVVPWTMGLDEIFK